MFHHPVMNEFNQVPPANSPMPFMPDKWGHQDDFTAKSTTCSSNLGWGGRWPPKNVINKWGPFRMDSWNFDFDHVLYSYGIYIYIYMWYIYVYVVSWNCLWDVLFLFGVYSIYRRCNPEGPEGSCLFGETHGNWWFFWWIQTTKQLIVAKNGDGAIIIIIIVAKYLYTFSISTRTYHLHAHPYARTWHMFCTLFRVYRCMLDVEINSTRGGAQTPSGADPPSDAAQEGWRWLASRRRLERGRCGSRHGNRGHMWPSLIGKTMVNPLFRWIIYDNFPWIC